MDYPEHQPTDDEAALRGEAYHLLAGRLSGEVDLDEIRRLLGKSGKVGCFDVLLCQQKHL